MSKKKVTFPQPTKPNTVSSIKTTTTKQTKCSPNIDKKTSISTPEKCETTADTIENQITPAYIKKKFISVLDHLDTQVGKFRIEAFSLVKKRDFLLTCIDLLKSDDQFENISLEQRGRIKDLNKRLNRIFLQVSTIRDPSQERSLEQINDQINSMIGMSDPRESIKRCQMFLNAFDSSKNDSDADVGPIDKNFELILLGCTIDDQREIRNRLEALHDYMKKHN